VFEENEEKWKERERECLDSDEDPMVMRSNKRNISGRDENISLQASLNDVQRRNEEMEEQMRLQDERMDKMMRMFEEQQKESKVQNRKFSKYMEGGQVMGYQATNRRVDGLEGNVMKVRTQVIHQQETLNYHGEQINYMQEDSNQPFYEDEEDDYILPERTSKKSKKRTPNRRSGRRRK